MLSEQLSNSAGFELASRRKPALGSAQLSESGAVAPIRSAKLTELANPARLRLGSGSWAAETLEIMEVIGCEV